MQVLDRAAAYRGMVSDPYAFMLLALLHDIGKIEATEVIGGRIHAYGHEVLGLPLLDEFLERLVSKNSVRKYLRNMVPLHMKPNVAAFNRVSLKSTNHMFDGACAPEDLIYMAMSDRPVKAGDVPFSGDSDFLFERLAEYREMMSRPYIVIPFYVSHAPPEKEVRINTVLAQDEPDRDRSRKVCSAPKCTAGKRSRSGSVNPAAISGRPLRAFWGRFKSDPEAKVLPYRADARCGMPG